MGQQRLNQKKTAAPTRSHPTKTSVKSSVHPVEELQAAIGNREMGRLMETNRLPHPSSPFPKLQGELPLLGGMMPVSQGTIQRQPLFRGLSQELNAEMGTLALPETGAVVQRKLTLGTPGDMYEQEADSVARQVVEEIHSSPFREQNTQPEEESKPEVGEAGRVQRQITVRASGDAGGELSSEWEGELQRAKSGGQPLSLSVKEPMERAFGADFSGVRLHTGAQADRLARSIQAYAFTTGQDVFFRQGAYEPGSRGGQELLAHELTHVEQQERYAVKHNQRKETKKRDVEQGKRTSSKEINRKSIAASRSKQHNIYRKYAQSLSNKEVADSAKTWLAKIHSVAQLPEQQKFYDYVKGRSMEEDIYLLSQPDPERSDGVKHDWREEWVAAQDGMSKRETFIEALPYIMNIISNAVPLALTNVQAKEGASGKEIDVKATFGAAGAVSLVNLVMYVLKLYQSRQKKNLGKRSFQLLAMYIVNELLKYGFIALVPTSIGAEDKPTVIPWVKENPDAGTMLSIIISAILFILSIVFPYLEKKINKDDPQIIEDEWPRPSVDDDSI